LDANGLARRYLQGRGFLLRPPLNSGTFGGRGRRLGYDIHITRAGNWFEAESSPITLEAWIAYVNLDPEMRLDGRADSTTTTGEPVSCVSPGLAVWTAYSKDGHDGNHAWFDHGHSCIVVKNPDDEILRKMSRIAEHFQARVQGDDGEDYDPNGNPIEDPPKRSWWRRLLGS
jgi:hypothetical protein